MGLKILRDKMDSANLVAKVSLESRVWMVSRTHGTSSRMTSQTTLALVGPFLPMKGPSLLALNYSHWESNSLKPPSISVKLASLTWVSMGRMEKLLPIQSYPICFAFIQQETFHFLILMILWRSCEYSKWVDSVWGLGFGSDEGLRELGGVEAHIADLVLTSALWEKTEGHADIKDFF